MSSGRWFVSPAVDLLFCCGGALWLLVASHYAFGWQLRYAMDGPGVFAGSVAALIGVICLSDAHVAASLFRFYGTDKLRQRSRAVSYLIPAALACLGVASLFNTTVLALGLRAYLLLITHHLAWQTYGIVLLYCRKQGSMLSPQRKLGLKLFFSALTLHGMAQQLGNPKFLSVGSIFSTPFLTVPEGVLATTQAVLIAALLLVALQNLRASTHDRLPFACWLLLGTSVLIYSFAIEILQVFWLYVPAFFHGSQYIVVLASTRLSGGQRDQDRRSRSVLSELGRDENTGFWLWAMAIGVAIYIGIPTTLSHFGFNLITAFNAVFWSVNLFHFAIDAVMWKGERAV
ncbi:MAG: hypothetical protein AB7W16_20600 [Candidatus Obscuribacterales bacterium]